MQNGAVAEDNLRVVDAGAVGQSQNEELQGRRLEQQFLVLAGQLAEARQLLRKVLDDVDRGGQQVVELLDLVGLGHVGLEERRLAVLVVVEARQVGRRVHVRPHQGRDEWHGRRRRGFLRWLGLRGQSAAAALQRIRPNDFLHHPHSQTLLEATELTAIPAPLVDGARFVGETHILGALLHGSLEEAFAALAGACDVWWIDFKGLDD